MIDCPFKSERCSRQSEVGMTLIEILIVMSVLVALTGMIMININPDRMRFSSLRDDNSPRGVATQNTMMAIRNAIFGDSVTAGYWQDMGRQFDYWPRYLEWLQLAPSPVNVFGSSVGSDATRLSFAQRMLVHSAPTRLGWRGPYLDAQWVDIPPTVSGILRLSNEGRVYRAPSDAWGNPILLVPPANCLATWPTQVSGTPSNAATNRYVLNNCRLVSAGSNGRFDSIYLNPAGHNADFQAFQHQPSLKGDDIILWLRE